MAPAGPAHVRRHTALGGVSLLALGCALALGVAARADDQAMQAGQDTAQETLDRGTTELAAGAEGTHPQRSQRVIRVEGAGLGTLDAHKAKDAYWASVDAAALIALLTEAGRSDLAHFVEAVRLDDDPWVSAAQIEVFGIILDPMPDASEQAPEPAVLQADTLSADADVQPARDATQDAEAVIAAAAQVQERSAHATPAPDLTTPAPVALPVPAASPARLQPVSAPVNEGPAPVVPAGSSMSADDLFASVFGAKPAVIPELDYPIILDGSFAGTTVVRPGEGPHDTMVNARVISALLQPILTDDAMAGLSALTAEATAGQLSLAQLEVLGVEASFDPSLLALVITVPKAIRRTQVFGFSRSAPILPEDVIRPAGFSAIANATALYEEATRPDTPTEGRVRAQLDLAVNMGGLVLETGARWRNDADEDEAEFARSFTRLTYDLPGRRARLRLGDISAIGSDFVQSTPLLGASVGREWGLQPWRTYVPRANQEFELDETSSVAVMLNGAVAQRLRLQPGRYRLEDLPVRVGLTNDVRIEITGVVSGRTRVVEFRAFSAASLLAKGETDFGFSAGVERAFETDGTIRYKSDRAVVSGFIEHGLGEAVTVGFSGRADADGGLVGLRAANANVLGGFEVRGAHSDFSEVGRGLAVDAFYASNLFLKGAPGLGEGVRLNAAASYADEDFALTGEAGASSPDAWRASAALSGRMARVGWRLGASRSWPQSGDWTEDTVTTSLSTTVGPAFVSASVNYSSDQFGPSGLLSREAETIARLSIGVPLGGGRGLDLGYDSETDFYEAVYSDRFARGAHQLSYAAGVARDEFNETGRFGLNYQNPRMEASASRSLDRDLQADGDTVTSQRTRLALGSALVFAQGRAAISRPVLDNFLIFDKHEAVRDEPIALNPRSGETSMQYDARSDWLGPLVAHRVSGYAPSSFSVAPLGGAEEAAITPHTRVAMMGYRSGAVVEVGDAQVVSIIGEMIGQDGEPVALASGLVRDLAGIHPDVSFFTNRSGRFYFEGLAPGAEYEVTIEGSATERARFTVPKAARGLLRAWRIVMERARDA